MVPCNFDTYRDRSFDVRNLLKKEDDFWPAIAVGLQDFAGTGIYAGEYVVATKTFDNTLLPGSVKVTGGLGWVAQRSDGTPGTVEVWQSSDQIQVTLREGVLVGTKGLGGDMRSAQAQTVIAARDGQGGGGERLITLARLDGTAQAVPFACDVTHPGPETIQIVDRRLSARHFRENCAYGDTTFSNDYWVEAATGKIRRSRHWAGPQFGYMAIDLLKE